MEKLISIQCIRGVAALLVVMSHSVHKLSQINGGGEFNLGNAGVDLFFVVSGFVMSYVTTLSFVKPFEFFRARFIRIVPLYWLLSLVALLVYVISPQLVNSSGGITSIIHSFTLFPSGDKFLIQNGWTLSYEFYFYIIMTACIYIDFKRRLELTSVALVVLFVLGVLFDSELFWVNNILFEFFLGVLAYHFLSKFKPSANGGVLLVVVGVLGFIVLDSDLVKLRSIYWGVPSFFVFVGVVSLESLFRKNKEKIKPFEILGDWSYSIYLVHPFFIAACGIVFRKVGFNIPVAGASILVFGSILLGGFVYRYLEQPSIYLFKKIFAMQPAKQG